MTRLRRMMLDELQRRNYSEITTRKNADPSVCSLSVDTLSSNSPLALLQARAALSTISTKPIECAGALPALDWVPNRHSNPITQRVRRRRQRLPPSLLFLIRLFQQRPTCSAATEDAPLQLVVT